MADLTTLEAIRKILEAWSASTGVGLTPAQMAAGEAARKELEETAREMERDLALGATTTSAQVARTPLDPVFVATLQATVRPYLEAKGTDADDMTPESGR